MDKKLIKIEIINTIIVLITGIFLHFSYNLSNQNIFVGTFSAINESTWEHLKLIFFPMLITSIISYFYLKRDYNNYLWIKTKSIIIAMLFIVIFFYTVSGIIGKNIAFLNISSFFIAIFLSEYYTFKKINKNYYKNNTILASIILVLLFLSFIIFTFFTPRIGLFKDPLTNSYGINLDDI